ncbi:Fe-S cluster assembly protein SufD [Dickeya chrysanthemi]|uniref:Fe-S cluster assembly protein SufD n=1 Tax=Dickeya chrysanthemi TaxID=556 RepID=UPI001CF514A5|nr:Fe-S cluster assembly protein SufD [Dickeya chrysanthemi]MCA7006351.1 Fe-S cluster assembly protein SufD [Dickeya chrysanthemi]
MAGLPTNSKAQQALQQWQRLFDAAAPRTDDARQHWQQIKQLGIPHRKLEHWKYTPLERLLAHEFTSITAETEVTPAQRNALALPVDGWRLVFVDGHFSRALSDGDSGPYQVEIIPSVRRQSGLPPIQPEVFLHLTESLAVEQTLIQVGNGVIAEKPLYLLHISSGQPAALNTLHYRHHARIGAGASATLIEHYASLEGAAHFSGARLTIDAGENSVVEHYKLGFEATDSYHFAHNDLRLAQAAQLHSHSFLLGAGLTRHHTSAQMNGEGATLSMNSLMVPTGNEVCDTRTYLEHNQGFGESRQLHKAIVRDRARGVFNGLIKVAPGALKTDGKMTNNNLLLGRLAEVDTKPQLEIYADDVKCSHGATVGRIDEDQLFYLRSRGIGEQAAQQMIIFAFAAELTEAIRDDRLRDAVLARVAQRLQALGGETA